MAKLSTKDYDISIDGQDMTDHLESVTIPDETEKLDATAFGSGARSYVPGLQAGEAAFTFHQDFAANSVYATLNGAKGTNVEVIAKPTSAAVSSTNPSFTFDIYVDGFDLLTGSVGELSKFSRSYSITSTIAHGTS